MSHRLDIKPHSVRTSSNRFTSINFAHVSVKCQPKVPFPKLNFPVTKVTPGYSRRPLLTWRHKCLAISSTNKAQSCGRMQINIMVTQESRATRCLQDMLTHCRRTVPFAGLAALATRQWTRFDHSPLFFALRAMEMNAY